jgi:hypothetical protein
LGDEDESAAREWNSSYEAETKGDLAYGISMCGNAEIVVLAYCRVEQSTRNSKEDPCIDG